MNTLPISFRLRHARRSLHRPAGRRLLFIIAAVLTLSGNACTSTASMARPGVSGATVEEAAYPKLSNNVTARLYRLLLHTNPLTKKRAFYGNYGGPGNRGGAPVDAMDALFLEHDRAYLGKRSRKQMIAADQLLVEALMGIDPDILDPTGRAYRKRAITFFSSSFSRMISKPLLCHFRKGSDEARPSSGEEARIAVARARRGGQ
jgi:hypothetical protein